MNVERSELGVVEVELNRPATVGNHLWRGELKGGERREERERERKRKEEFEVEFGEKLSF